jgi:hypothetical protein
MNGPTLTSRGTPPANPSCGLRGATIQEKAGALWMGEGG